MHAILNAHPDLCVPPETHFLRRFVASRSGARRLDRGGRSELSRILREDRLASRLRLSVQDLPSEVPQRESAASLYRSLMEASARRRGKSRWGDKDPRLLECLDTVARDLPEARVVHVIRDPRDVVSSRMRAAWARRWPWVLHPFVYRSQIGQAVFLGRRLLGTRFLEVRYEDLLAEPEKEVGRICEGVELDFDPSMLDFASNAAEIVMPDEQAWKAKVLGPLRRGNTGRWRETLTDYQVGLTETVCRAPMAHYRYESSGALSRLAVEQRLLIRAKSLLAPAFDRVYRWRR